MLPHSIKLLSLLVLSLLLAACSTVAKKPQQAQQSMYLMPRSYQLELQDNTPGSPVETGKIELHYVELLGLPDYQVEKKINRQIRQISGTENPYNGSEDVTVSVTDAKLSDNYLHFMVEIYRMKHGAANGQTTVSSSYFDLKTGAIISLNQVLKPGYQSVLNEKVSQWLAKQSYQSDFQSLAKEPCYYQDANTLYLCFSQYAIAPGSAGVINVPIEKSAIKAWIVKGSLLD